MRRGIDLLVFTCSASVRFTNMPSPAKALIQFESQSQCSDFSGLLFLLRPSKALKRQHNRQSCQYQSGSSQEPPYNRRGVQFALHQLELTATAHTLSQNRVTQVQSRRPQATPERKPHIHLQSLQSRHQLQLPRVQLNDLDLHMTHRKH